MAKDYGKYFNIAHIEPESHIYGPGKRFVIWLQGCSLACDGCWNKEMWSLRERRLIQREELLKAIASAQDIRGITVLGGEPLEQWANLKWLLDSLRADTALTIFLYSGYEEEELRQAGHWTWLNQTADILVLGRYIQGLRDTSHQWKGSGNQRVIHPIGSREKIGPTNCNEAEIVIGNDGQMTILGYPDAELITALQLEK